MNSLIKQNNKEKMENAKLIKDITYGEVVLDTTGNSKFPIALIQKDVFNVEEHINLDNANINTRWIKYTDTIVLLIYWLEHKDGFFLPFEKSQRKIIKQIIKKKALVVGNDENSKKVLVIDVLHKEPLDWIKSKLF